MGLLYLTQVLPRPQLPCLPLLPPAAPPPQVRAFVSTHCPQALFQPPWDIDLER